MKPETQQQWRRAFRTGVYVITTLVALGFVGWIIRLVQTDAPSLTVIAMGLLGILTISVLGYTAENVAQRIRFKAGLDGVEGEIGSQDGRNDEGDNR